MPKVFTTVLRFPFRNSCKLCQNISQLHFVFLFSAKLFATFQNVVKIFHNFPCFLFRETFSQLFKLSSKFSTTSVIIFSAKLCTILHSSAKFFATCLQFPFTKNFSQLFSFLLKFTTLFADFFGVWSFSSVLFRLYSLVVS